MRNLKMLRELPGEFVGSAASDEVAAEAKRLLIGTDDIREFMAAWLDGDNHAAFRIGDQMVWTLMSLERPVVVHWLVDDDADEEHNDNMKIFAYETEEEAYANACKLFFGWVLTELSENAEALRQLTGWQQDVVMMIDGADFYVIRTYHDGRVRVDGSEEIAIAYGIYVEEVSKLSREIEFSSPFPGLEKNPMYPKIVTAFLEREAGAALQNFGRHRLSLAMDGTAAISTHGGLKLNVSELARGLYTDRPNLTRHQGKSSLANITPEKLKALFEGDD